MKQPQKRLQIYRPISGESFALVADMQQELRKEHSHFAVVRKPHITLGKIATNNEESLRKTVPKISHILLSDLGKSEIFIPTVSLRYIGGRIGTACLAICFDNEQIDTEKKSLANQFNLGQDAVDTDKNFVIIGRVDSVFATQRLEQQAQELCPSEIALGPIGHSTNSLAVEAKIRSLNETQRRNADSKNFFLRPTLPVGVEARTVRPGTIPAAFLDSLRPSSAN